MSYTLVINKQNHTKSANNAEHFDTNGSINGSVDYICDFLNKTNIKTIEEFNRNSDKESTNVRNAIQFFNALKTPETFKPMMFNLNVLCYTASDSGICTSGCSNFSNDGEIRGYGISSPF